MKSTTWLVARREISVRLRDKAFIFSSIFMLVIVAASVVLPALFASCRPRSRWPTRSRPRWSRMPGRRR